MQQNLLISRQQRRQIFVWIKEDIPRNQTEYFLRIIQDLSGFRREPLRKSYSGA